ncbi:MAG: hypothetical protein IJL91_07110 [Bacteroidales bacterium]|nr:hypothetical protein [Bacteroidales bacterium]
MITKQRLLRRLEIVTETQGFITATQFARFMGVKTADHAKKEFLENLERVKGKYYFIDDVIDAIMENKKLKEEE